MENAAIFLLGLGGFLVLWPISVWRRDASMVDFWWGPGQSVMAAAAWFAAGQPSGIAGLLCACVAIWGLRLGIQLGRRRILEGREDPRYTTLRRHWSPGFWWKSLFVVYLLQAGLQMVIAAAPVAAIQAGTGQAGTGEIGVLAALGALIWLTGMTVETVADVQLDLYRRKHGHGGLLTRGLRALVRHPHYSGEILVWAGIALIALDAGIWWAPLSALLVTVLLWKVSGVPFLDEHMRDTRSRYTSYARSVPALVPTLRRAQRLAQAGRRERV